MKKLILLYLLTLSYSQDHWETAIYANDEWSYLVPIEEPNSNWNSINYDDSSWLVSTGGFGYGDNDDGTLIPNAFICFIFVERLKYQNQKNWLHLFYNTDYV